MTDDDTHIKAHVLSVVASAPILIVLVMELSWYWFAIVAAVFVGLAVTLEHRRAPRMTVPQKTIAFVSVLIFYIAVAVLLFHGYGELRSYIFLILVISYFGGYWGLVLLLRAGHVRGWPRFLIGTAVVLTLLLVAVWLNRFLEIDTCLDMGGRFDYERGVCEYDKTGS